MQPNFRHDSLVDMKHISQYFVPLFFAVFISFHTQGQSVTLSLNNVPEGIQCNEVWTEQNLDLRLVETTSEDCTTGSCYFGFYNESLALWPSRLMIDLSSLQNIQTVEIDIEDLCGPDCTRAFLMDETLFNIDSVKNVTAGPQTLILDNPTQAFLTELAISSCEGAISEIRIFQNTSSIENAPSVDRKVLRIVDALGREVPFTTGQLLFYIYDDGSVEKKIVIN